MSVDSEFLFECLARFISHSVHNAADERCKLDLTRREIPYQQATMYYFVYYCKYTNNDVSDDFPKVSEYFPKIFEDI